MKKSINIILLLLSFSCMIMLNASYYSSLHNVDLSWNVKHLDLVDCNGIICEDITYFYQKGYMFLWIYPILNFIVLSLCFFLLYRIINFKD